MIIRAVLVALLILLVSLFIGFYDPEDKHTNHVPLYGAAVHTFQSVSAPDVKLNVRKWTVDNPIGLVFLIHGYAEYIARYEEVANFFNNANYNVYGLDHQGHGLSGGDRVHVRDFMDYTSDFIAFVNHIEETDENTKHLPRYMIGHSMGGAIAIQTAISYPDLWKGVVISAPAVEKLPSALLLMTNAMCAVNPKLPLIGFELDLAGLNSDPNKIALYKEDDLIYHGFMKVGWGNAIISAIHRLYEDSHLWPSSVPVLFLHGSDDTITPISAAREFYSELPGSVDKTWKEYPGLRHELFQESERNVVMKDIASWLAQQ